MSDVAPPPAAPPRSEETGSNSGRICISAGAASGIETEVAARLAAMKLQPVLLPRGASGAESHAILDRCGVLVSLYPAGSADALVLGIAAGLGLPVFVLSSTADATPYPRGTRLFTTIQALVDAVPSIEQRFVDAGLLQRLGACADGLAWYNTRYPGGAHAKEWSAEEQAEALKNGGARWLKTGFDHKLVEHLSMAGQDFSDADLTGLRLSRGDLAGAILVNARIAGAQIIATTFKGADVSGADLSGAALKRCDITGVKAVKTGLAGASMDLCTLDGADGTDVQLAQARLMRTTFIEAGLQGGDLTAVSAQDCRFDGADLQGARLTGAHFTRCQFPGASFVGADLQGAVFVQCNLTGADLTGVDLNQTYIQLR